MVLSSCCQVTSQFLSIFREKSKSMRSRYGNGNSRLLLIPLVLIIVFVIVSFFHTEEGGGVVDRTWIEKHVDTDCETDDNGSRSCDTSVSYDYYVQLRDGRVFQTLNRSQLNGLKNGQHISYFARGFRWEILGLRLSVPTIWDYKILEP